MVIELLCEVLLRLHDGPSRSDQERTGELGGGIQGQLEAKQIRAGNRSRQRRT